LFIGFAFLGSDSQLEILMAAAHPLAPAARSAFLAAVAARLAGGASDLGDGAVARACRELQRAYSIGHEARWAR
jgi:hypothetical protein